MFCLPYESWQPDFPCFVTSFSMQALCCDITGTVTDVNIVLNLQMTQTETPVRWWKRLQSKANTGRQTMPLLNGRYTTRTHCSLSRIWRQLRCAVHHLKNSEALVGTIYLADTTWHWNVGTGSLFSSQALPAFKTAGCGVNMYGVSAR